MSSSVFRCSYSYGLAIFAIVCGLIPTIVVRAESWTDLRGNKTIEARMIGMWDDYIVLELPGGRRTKVKKEALQAASRIQAETLAAKIEQARTSRVDLIRQRAEEASAPAPTPLPQPTAAPAYVAMPAKLSPEAARKHAIEQLAAGHLMGGFDSLPTTYREQLNSISQAAVAKVDPATFDAVVKLLHDMGDTLVTHQRWFKSHPRFEAMGEDSAENVQSLILSAAGILRDGFDPQFVSHENLRQQPVSVWLKAFDDRTSPYLALIMDDYADFESLVEPTFSAPDKDGVVTMSTPNPKNPRQMVKTSLVSLDGYWTSPEVGKRIEELQTTVNETPDGSIGGSTIAMMISAGIGPAMDPLKNAPNEDEFHAAMESMLAQAGPAMTAAKAAIPPEVLAKIPMPGTSGGGDPYGGDPYGGDPYGGDPYGGQSGGDPYGDDPYAGTPMATP